MSKVHKDWILSMSIGLLVLCLVWSIANHYGSMQVLYSSGTPTAPFMLIVGMAGIGVSVMGKGNIAWVPLAGALVSWGDALAFLIQTVGIYNSPPCINGNTKYQAFCQPCTYDIATCQSTCTVGETEYQTQCPSSPSMIWSMTLISVALVMYTILIGFASAHIEMNRRRSRDDAVAQGLPKAE